MKKKILKSILISASVVIFALVGMFLTDAHRAGHLMKPIFAVSVSETQICDTYKGPGYTVETKSLIGKDGEKHLVQVTMYVGDKVISASIT